MHDGPARLMTDRAIRLPESLSEHDGSVQRRRQDPLLAL